MLFSEMSQLKKEYLIKVWKLMPRENKEHFINQVALVLSIWGSGKEGKKLVVDVLDNLINDGSKDLSDFGLYLNKLLEARQNGMKQKIKRASVIIEGYRLKHGLPSEPHKELNF